MKGFIRNLLREGLLDEVSSDVYDLVKTKYSNSRIIMSKYDEISYKPEPNQPVRFKPKGLWYGIGSSWIDWVKGEMPEWEYDNVFVLDIDESRMKIIRTPEELIEFDKKYTGDEKGWDIDWSMVARDFDGIEIAPHNYIYRADVDWYRTWDVSSGCIWGDGVIRDIKKIK